MKIFKAGDIVVLTDADCCMSTLPPRGTLGKVIRGNDDHFNSKQIMVKWLLKDSYNFGDNWFSYRFELISKKELSEDVLNILSV